MGNSLDKPITEKSTETGNGSDGTVKWAVSSMQGWRITMEDAHLVSPIPPIHLKDDDNENSHNSVELPGHYLFAVFDGHGGTTAAEFGSQNLLQTLTQNPHFVSYARLWNKIHHPAAVSNDKSSNDDDDDDDKDSNNRKHKNKKDNSRAAKHSHREERRLLDLLRLALENVFLELDRKLLQEMVKQGRLRFSNEHNSSHSDPGPHSTAQGAEEEGTYNNGLVDVDVDVEQQEQQRQERIAALLEQRQRQQQHELQLSGSTITAVLLTPDFVVCANLGDSRTVLDSMPLSTDHKPDLEEESNRIQRTGGRVLFGRVDGELAVSRALGDFEYKHYASSALHLRDMDDLRQLATSFKVSSFPKIEVRHLQPSTDKVLILACDGIWDVFSNAECCKLVQTLVTQEGESDLGLVAEEILDVALQKGSRDNMTIILIQFPGLAIGKGGGVRKRRSQRNARQQGLT